MSSALKSIAAGVVVALFGGLLLAGVLTAPEGDDVLPAAVTDSPSLMTTDESLSGMVIEGVEPGVLQVVNDGVRDLSIKPSDGLSIFGGACIIGGLDGSIWKREGDWMVRLGDEGSVETRFGDPGYQTDVVAADGTI